MKKIFLKLSLILIILTSSPAYAMESETTSRPPGLENYSFRINRNGHYIDYNLDQLEPYEEGEKVFIPLRLILENTGYKVQWDQGLVSIYKGDKLVESLDTKKPSPSFLNRRGHIMIDLDFFKDFEDFKTYYDTVNKTIFIRDLKPREDDLIEYSLGRKKLVDDQGQDFDFFIEGAIRPSKKDKAPLIVFLHGAHSFENYRENRYDMGFAYLMKDLDNYNAISLNLGINYSFEAGEPIKNARLKVIFEETLKELIRANGGEENSFPVDLENRLDLDQVILVGHSRSGEAIFELYNEYLEDPRLKVRGLLALAPGRMYLEDYSRVDVPVGLIIPELDGDVMGLDGQWIFDELIDNQSRKSDSQLIYLYGANHNAFNQALLIQDEGKHWYQGEKYKISPEDQREFTKNYLEVFIGNVLANKPLVNNTLAVEGELFGERVLVSNHKNSSRIYTSREGLAPITYENLKLKSVVSSYIPNKNTAGLFYHPGDREELELLNISWDKKPASLRLPIQSSQGKEKICFYIASDSTSPLNKGRDQALALVLEDEDKKKSRLIIEDNLSLAHVDGQPIFDNTAFSSHTPLSIMEVDLNKFEGIDKDRLVSLTMEFSQRDSGSLMLRHIDLR